MSMGNRDDAARKSASPLLALGAIAVLVLFIVGIGYINLAPRRGNLVVPKTETTKWIEQIAKDSEGDINKLSPEDRQKLQRLSQNKGEMYLKMFAPKK